MEDHRESSKTGFKSSFAQEVAENIKNSSNFNKHNQNTLSFLGTSISNPFTEEPDVTKDLAYQRSLASSSSLGGRLSRDDGASLTSGYFDSSSIDFHQDDIFSKERRVNSQAFDVIKMPSLGNQEDVNGCPPADDTWMTSSQFVKLLEIQEANENINGSTNTSKGISEKTRCVEDLTNSFMLPIINNEKKSNISHDTYGSSMSNVRSNVNSSYLDKEAEFSFKKLKKTCTDLGFAFSEQEWCQVANMLPCRNDSTQNTVIEKHDIMVKNGDFFEALHLLIKNKHNYLQNNGTNRQDNGHKCSMKSDSGGEMESCRSSDSENLNDTNSCTFGNLKRTLTKQSNQRSSISSEDSAERNKSIGEDDEYQISINRLAEKLADRDTELIKTKFECQRLNKLVTNAQMRSDKMLDGGSKLHQHRRKNLELEKEVDNLKWQLKAMESSRKTYEEATQRLVSFLEQVTTVLQGTSPVQRKLLESTRAEVSKVARRARIQGSQPYLSRAAKRFSLDSISQNSLMSRAESMPGLNSGFGDSLLSLSTITTEASSANGENSPHTASNGKKFSRKHPSDVRGREIGSARESLSSRNSSEFSTGQNYFEKSGYKTLPSSHYVSSSNSRSASAGKSKQRIKRSQSTSSGNGHVHGQTRHHSLCSGMQSRTQSPMPSLKEHDYLMQPEDQSISMYSHTLPTNEVASRSREMRKSRISIANAGNDILDESAKTSTLKSKTKRLSTSRSKSGSRDPHRKELESIMKKVESSPLKAAENTSHFIKNTSSPGIGVVEVETRNISKTTKGSNNLKQIIRIGNDTTVSNSIDFNTRKGAFSSEALQKNHRSLDTDSDEDSSKAASTQEKSERKYIPRRSASTASITKQSQNQTAQSLRNTNDAYEGAGSENFTEQNQTMNKISARFSLSRGMEKIKNRRLSQSSSMSRDRSASPPPMPIEAVVQVNKNNFLNLAPI